MAAKTLSLAQVKKITAPAIGLALTIDNGVSQLQSFRAIHIFIGKGHSIIAANVLVVISDMLRFKNKYKAALAADPLLLLKLFLLVDYGVHEFFHSCAGATDINQVDTSSLDFREHLAQIKRGTFTMNVPPYYLTLHAQAVETNKADKTTGQQPKDVQTDDGPPPPKRAKTGEVSRPDRKNSQADPELKLTNQQWTQLRARVGTAPMINNVASCVLWHSLGRCAKGSKCQRAANHRRLNAAEKKAYKAWLSENKQE
jgi:hypothetical protein